jgi:hypothetical protein
MTMAAILIVFVGLGRAGLRKAAVERPRPDRFSGISMEKTGSELLAPAKA